MLYSRAVSWNCRHLQTTRRISVIEMLQVQENVWLLSFYKKPCFAAITQFVALQRLSFASMALNLSSVCRCVLHLQTKRGVGCVEKLKGPLELLFAKYILLVQLKSTVFRLTQLFF